MIDTLAYARKLKHAGLSDAQAEAHAEALGGVLDDQLATKQDLRDLEARLEAKIEALGARLDARIDGVEAGLGAKVTALDAKLDTRIDALRAELLLRMGQVEHRLTIRLGMMLAAGIGALATLQALA